MNELPVKKHFLSLLPTDISRWLEEQQEPKFRAQQISDWIFKFHVTSPHGMSNISKTLKEKLQDSFLWELPKIVERQDSQDGSTKLLLRTLKGQVIESVILRYPKRVSLCVSSQVGCKLACSFCQTGKLGFFRSLSREEILSQYVLAQQILTLEGGRRLSHVVFMGMGEPFDNFDAVITAANTLCNPDGFGLSARNVTLSTSGLVPQIRDLPQVTKASLALSLHATRDDLRSELMPINNRYPLAQLKDALLHYQQQSGNIITIEYILIKDKNSGIKEAKELVKFLHGLKAKVNLIPFNPHPGLPYEKPNENDISAFQQHLSKRGFPAPVRYSRGLEISGGCGQLAAKVAGELEKKPWRKNVVTLGNEKNDT